MPYATLEIRQINDDLEPLFQVWVRTHIMVEIEDKPGFSDRILVDQPICEPKSVSPPYRWPVPADHEGNLADAWEWYIEEYSIQQTPVTEIRAKHVRKAFYDWGQYNFEQLFNTNDGLNYYNQIAETALSHEITVEIHAWDATILAWPWEALVDKNKDFMGQIMAFERRVPVQRMEPYDNPRGPQDGPLNILLVTARGTNDVDYRIAGRQLTGMTDVTLLNPPTLENLQAVLADRSKNFGVIHFDCHGGWGYVSGEHEEGYILLGDGDGGLVPVTGEKLISALGPGTPPHIFLNACRSAKASRTGRHRRDSFAKILLDHPQINDVTAMAYNLSVDGLSHILEYYYTGIANGLRPSIGLQNGRIMMANEPYRTCIGGKVLLQDWMVPVIYLKQQTTFDPVYDRTYLKGGFKSKLFADKFSFRFTGHDDLFLLLDRERKGKLNTIYSLVGLTGQGKTAFLNEYAIWMELTGDITKIVRIDVEHIKDLNLLLDAIAQKLGWKKSATLQQLAATLNSGSQLIMIDNMPEQPGIFAELLDELQGGNTFVLTAGRLPLSYKNALPLLLKGLEEGHRWQFVSEFLSYRRGARSEILSAKEYRAEAAELVKYCQGHPSTMMTVFVEYEAGIEATKLIDMLRRGDPSLADERLRNCLSSRELEEASDLLKLLPLCDYIFNRPVLKAMLISKYGNKGTNILELCEKKLLKAGLLDQDGVLHPLLPGWINSNFPEELIRENLSHLLGAMHIIFSGPKIPVTGNILERAFLAAITSDIELAVILHPALSIYYEHQNQWDKSEKIDNDVIDILVPLNDLNRVVGFFFSVCERLIKYQHKRQLIRWLDLGQAIINAFPEGLKKLMETILIYGNAKIAEIEYNLAKYEQLLNQAKKNLGEFEIERLKDLIDFDIAQLAVSNRRDLDNAAIIAENLAKSSLGSDSSVFRLCGEIQMAIGNLENARFSLKRALTISRKEGIRTAEARIIQLIGELEVTAGNLKQAKTMMNEAAMIFETEGDRLSAGVTYHRLGKIYYEQDLYEEAADLFINSAICFKNGGDKVRFQIIAQNYAILKNQLDNGSAGILDLKWRIRLNT